MRRLVFALLAAAASASPAQAAPQYKNGWGAPGTGPGQFDQPIGIAAGGGRVFVLDGRPQQRVQAFSPTGGLLASWSVSDASKITADAAGNVLVERGLDCPVSSPCTGGGIDRYDERGTLKPPHLDTDDPDLGPQSLPDIAAGVGEAVFTIGDETVETRRYDGGYDSFGTGRQGAELTVDAFGTLFVVDAIGSPTIVHRFALDGTRLGVNPAVPGDTDDIAADPFGSLHLLQRKSARIVTTSAEGGSVETWGSAGPGPDQFGEPTDIAAGDDGSIYVLDAGRSRVLRFGPPDGTAVPPAPTLGQDANAAPVRGTVRVRARGQVGFRSLDERSRLPLGSTIDARRGAVTIVAARNRRGGTHAAVLSGARFKVRQLARLDAFAEVDLAAVPRARCRAARASIAQRRRISRAALRRFLAVVRGLFRVNSKTISLTVHGTRFEIEERCDRTIVRLEEGEIVIRNRRTGRRARLKGFDKTYVVRR